MDSAEEMDETAILKQQLGNRQTKRQLERGVVLRVYNYYRVLLSFVLLIVFY